MVDDRGGVPKRRKEEEKEREKKEREEEDGAKRGRGAREISRDRGEVEVRMDGALRRNHHNATETATRTRHNMTETVQS